MDVVVCELLLPQVGGLEVIERLRHRAPDLPIIAITGGNSICQPENLLAVATANGVVASLRKPIDRDQLLVAIGQSVAAG